MTTNTCECNAKGCPAHFQSSNCSGYAEILLMRIDMEDCTGTWFCEECGDDVLDTGVFRVADVGEQIKNRR